MVKSKIERQTFRLLGSFINSLSISSLSLNVTSRQEKALLNYYNRSARRFIQIFKGLGKYRFECQPISQVISSLKANSNIFFTKSRIWALCKQRHNLSFTCRRTSRICFSSLTLFWLFQTYNQQLFYQNVSIARKSFPPGKE